MSDQLFPEDILNARAGIRDLAKAAAAAAKAEEDREKEAKVAEQADELVEAVYEFFIDALGLSPALIEDVEYRIQARNDSAGGANLLWTMDDLEFRASYIIFNGALQPRFEVKIGGFNGTGWKTFHSLVSLGRIIP